MNQVGNHKVDNTTNYSGLIMPAVTKTFSQIA
jgi:hypothetical protein